MPLDPLTKAFLDQLDTMPTPKLWEMSPASARMASAVVMKLANPKDMPIGKIQNRDMPGPGGNIALRLYTPVAAGGEALPAVVYFHGGGFVIGDLESHDAICRLLAEQSGARVIAVDYRLAPEHKFPAAVEDAFAAVNWVEANAADIGVDANRIAVAGDSAGGTLSAVVCQLAKAQGGPSIAAQLLMFPVTQLGGSFSSLHEFAAGYFLEKQTMDWFFGHYLPAWADLSDARLSPLLAESVGGLPPAYVMLGGCDPLHDEGLAYAEKLRAAGVPVTIADYPGMVHCFIFLQAIVPQAYTALTDAANALRRVFGTL
ncbi:MAG: alpha/beta hydrolase [Alphaproteobacteria bacterium]|nr:alpha/beta hydrolase [Alphaproteobacteria bacterium]MDE2112310.1 alpha/beta hydrolase [Alphaproteobacteria bacterium]MDE2494292.1 alpha/beta hydrolase [Alphaproteobacteria bacterium]